MTEDKGRTSIQVIERIAWFVAAGMLVHGCLLHAADDANRAARQSEEAEKLYQDGHYAAAYRLAQQASGAPTSTQPALRGARVLAMVCFHSGRLAEAVAHGKRFMAGSQGDDLNALKPIVRDEPYDDRARTLVHHAQTAINHLPAKSPEAGTILSGGNDDRYRAVLTYFTHHHLPDILIDVAIIKGLTDGPDRAQDAPFDYLSPDPSPRRGGES